jgi:lipopolysaccharide transport system ATP-binding protein
MSAETRRRTPSSSSANLDDQNHHLTLNVNRFGSLEVEITGVHLSDNWGKTVQQINSGDPIRIEIDYVSHVLAEAPKFCVTISKEDGQICGEMMIDEDHFNLEGVRKHGAMILDIRRLDLSGGEYYFDVGIYDKDFEYAYDYHWHVYPLQVRSDFTHKGILAPPHNWSWADKSKGSRQLKITNAEV